MERFNGPGPALTYLSRHTIGDRCVLIGPRSRSQLSNVYVAARRKGIRVSRQKLENGDYLLTFKCHLSEDELRAIRSQEQARRASKAPELVEGEHKHQVRDLLEIEVGNYLDLTQNEYRIRQVAKRLGLKVSIQRHDTLRRVTRLS